MAKGCQQRQKGVSSGKRAKGCQQRQKGKRVSAVAKGCQQWQKGVSSGKRVSAVVLTANAADAVLQTQGVRNSVQKSRDCMPSW